MRKIISLMLMLIFVYSCATVADKAEDDGGTFRGKWWNYYDRGIAGSEKSEWENATDDLKKAISLRDKDQRMARTYGMHFTDYFPHRELGIVYFSTGQIDKAISELEESIRGEESAKAFYYLNRARKIILLRQNIRVGPPEIRVESPADGAAFNSLSLKVKGNVSGEGFISRILINNVPYRFEQARESVDFEKDITLGEAESRLIIIAEDLLGNSSEKTIAVTVDREGPAINIFDIVPGAGNGESFVRITGEISDGTGIRDLFIGEKAVRVNSSKSHGFDILVPQRKLVIQAFDVLDNETRAELDLEKELSAFNKKAGPVLLAFNGDKIFSFDKEPPVIRLKEPPETIEVFVDKYLVEGEVSDNKRVEKVMVNNKEVSIKEGRKIFFSRLVDLSKGKNRVTVEAFDSSGNKVAAVFTINRIVPEAAQLGSRMSITILPFEGRKGDTDITLLAYEHLIGSFVDQKRFSVIEREALQQILREHQITTSMLADLEHSIRVGRLMAANAILKTSVKEDRKSLEIVSRVINTETSEVMEVKDVYTEDKDRPAVRDLLDGLASKIAVGFPLIEGMVVNKDKGVIYSDMGSRAKIKKGMAVIFYRNGKEQKHPVTGKSLGRDKTTLGEGRIEDIQEDFSKIRLNNAGLQNINIKDMVITK